MPDKIAVLEEFLAKRGYSKYALKSEIVTEDMLDEMYLQTETSFCYSNNHFKDEDGNDNCKIIAADRNMFDMKPTLVEPCQ